MIMAASSFDDGFRGKKRGASVSRKPLLNAARRYSAANDPEPDSREGAGVIVGAEGRDGV
jgi:hypothetical protein